MKKIPLTKGKYALVDDEDYDFLMQWKWSFDGIYASRVECTPMVSGKRKQTTIRMHRVILNPLNGMVTDHINGNPLDNRRQNLRAGTVSQNGFNARKRSKSNKYKGVYYHNRDGLYTARLMANGITYRAPFFKNEADAARAYNDLAMKHHGEFARLNIIEEASL